MLYGYTKYLHKIKFFIYSFFILDYMLIKLMFLSLFRLFSPFEL